MNKTELRENILNIKKMQNLKFEETVLDTFLETLDLDSMYNTLSAKYSVTEWDQESPINGVEPSIIKDRLPYTLEGWKGKSYMIKDTTTDSIIIFQNEDFTTQGWNEIETSERLSKLANIQIDEMVNNYILVYCIESVSSK